MMSTDAPTIWQISRVLRASPNRKMPKSWRGLRFPGPSARGAVLPVLSLPRSTPRLGSGLRALSHS